MVLFGRKPVKGISQYELEKERVKAKFDSVFPARYASSKTKRAALHTALGIALDRDTNMHNAQKHGVIQRDEFEAIVVSLEEGGVISSQEALQLRAIAEEPLSD